MSEGVKGLPYAPPDRAFQSLDEYLAHRAKRATMGAPTLREVEPGIYVEEAGRSFGGTTRRYTRDELMQRFGFTR